MLSNDFVIIRTNTNNIIVTASLCRPATNYHALDRFESCPTCAIVFHRNFLIKMNCVESCTNCIYYRARIDRFFLVVFRTCTISSIIVKKKSSSRNDTFASNFANQEKSLPLWHFISALHLSRDNLFVPV